MISRLALLAVLATASAAAAAQEAGTALPGGGAALLQSCDDHKFETTVMASVDGQPRAQKVKICGVAGQSNADWKRTLEDAVNKVQANGKMAAPVREQIVTALRQEIGRLDMAVVTPVIGSGSLIAGLAAGPTKPVLGAPPTPVRPVTPPQTRSLQQDYGNLQPLPAPLPPPVVASAATASLLPALASPRITLLCSPSHDPRGTEECNDVYPSTIFTIRADERLADGISLRFLRKGDERGDVTLAALDRGQAMRLSLPRGVCAGITRGEVEIQVMRRPPGSSGSRQVVDAYGPYDLRC